MKSIKQLSCVCCDNDTMLYTLYTHNAVSLQCIINMLRAVSRVSQITHASTNLPRRRVLWPSAYHKYKILPTAPRPALLLCSLYVSYGRKLVCLTKGKRRCKLPHLSCGLMQTLYHWHKQCIDPLGETISPRLYSSRFVALCHTILGQWTTLCLKKCTNFETV